MKRIVVLLICCFILLCAGCSQQENNEEKVSVTTPAVVKGETGSGGAVSDAPVTAAGVMTGDAVTGKKEKNKKKEKKTVRIVTDPTGKKKKLKMGEVNIKNVGVKFCATSPPSVYAQVYDGHYYYLRVDGSNYTIYRDKGHKVGQFSLKDEYLVGFAKYGSDFYAITEKKYIYKTKKDWEAVEYPKIGYKDTVVIIDLKNNKVMPLHDDKGLLLGEYNFYENSLFYYNEETDTYTKKSIGDKNSEIPIPIPATTGEYHTPYSNNLKLIDGKWYFGTVTLFKDVITLWSLDLTSWKREKLISYKLKKGEYDGWDCEDGFLKMDHDYIYTMDYIIPLLGGRMTKLPGKVWRETICSNKKYIYYIDEDFRIHRITKKTLSHIVFSGMKAVNVQCMENCVYVVGYNKKYYKGYFDYKEELFDDDEDIEGDYFDYYTEEADANDEDEYFDKEDLIDYSRKKAKKKLKVNNKENQDSFDLYCMDLDGNHRERLWKGKIK